MNKEERLAVFDKIKKHKNAIDDGFNLEFVENVDFFTFGLSKRKFYKNKYIACKNSKIISVTDNWDQFLEEIKTKWVDVDGD